MLIYILNWFLTIFFIFRIEKVKKYKSFWNLNFKCLDQTSFMYAPNFHHHQQTGEFAFTCVHRAASCIILTHTPVWSLRENKLDEGETMDLVEAQHWRKGEHVRNAAWCPHAAASCSCVDIHSFVWLCYMAQYLIGQRHWHCPLPFSLTLRFYLILSFNTSPSLIPILPLLQARPDASTSTQLQCDRLS